MAEVNFLFGKNRQKTIGGIAVDAFLTESHTQSAEVTEYSVEEGSPISDHVTPAPDGLSITGIISPTSIYTSGNESGIDRVAECDQKFAELMAKGEPVDVVTGLRAYTNMVITEYAVNRSAENGRSLEFSMTLVKIRVITSKITPIAKLGGDTKTKQQTQQTANMGKVVGETPSPEQKGSFLDEIRANVGGWFQ